MKALSLQIVVSFALSAMLLTIATAVTTSSSSKLGAVDSGGNFIVANAIGTQASWRIVKRNASSDVLWTHTSAANGSIGTTIPVQIKVDGSDNIFVVGTGTTGEAGTSGHPFYFIQKLNSAGIVQWTKISNKQVGSQAQSLALDSSGNAYLLGNYSNYGRGTFQSDRVYYNELYKFSPSGTVMGGSVLTELPNTLNLRDVQIGVGNRVYLAGATDTYNSSVVLNAVVAQFNTDLVEIWHDYQYLGTKSFYSGVALDTSGNVVTVYGERGQNYRYTNSFYTSVFKHQADTGGTLWGSYQTDYGNDGSGVIIDSSGNVVIGGDVGTDSNYNTLSGLFVLSPSTGQLSYATTQQYGSNASDSVLAQDASGNYLLLSTNFQGTSASVGTVLAFSSSSGIYLGSYSFSQMANTNPYSLVPTSTPNTFFVGGVTYPSNSYSLYLSQAKFSGTPSLYTSASWQLYYNGP